jgi:hypothetical protein
MDAAIGAIMGAVIGACATMATGAGRIIAGAGAVA